MQPPSQPNPAVQTPAPDSVDADLERQVRQAQAQLIFDRSRSSNLVGIPVGLLLCTVLWGAVSHAGLLVWLAAKVGVTFGGCSSPTALTVMGQKEHCTGNGASSGPWPWMASFLA
jgi:hypothetical protein